MCMIIYCSILLRMRNFSDKILEKTKHTLCVPYPLFSAIVPVNEIMWNNIVEPDRPQITIRRVLDN